MHPLVLCGTARLEWLTRRVHLEIWSLELASILRRVPLSVGKLHNAKLMRAKVKSPREDNCQKVYFARRVNN